jgi:hypothetical protein
MRWMLGNGPLGLGEKRTGGARIPRALPWASGCEPFRLEVLRAALFYHVSPTWVENLAIIRDGFCDMRSDAVM